MDTRLLFITSHYFYPLTLAALERLQLNCRFTVVPYDDFSHIPQIYRQYQDSCDAVFVSGISAKGALEIGCGRIPQPVTAFQVDSDALHRDILRFAVENQSLHFDRVAMDFLLPLGSNYSVTDFLAMDDLEDAFTGNRKWMQEPSVQAHGAEQLIFERIVQLWRQGAIDCVICLYSGNISKLRELGIPCRCPFLSDAHLHRLIKDALVKIELKHLHENHPAIVQLFPLGISSLNEGQRAALNDGVRTFLKENLIDCVVQDNESCCSIITSLQVVRFLTDEFRTCRLLAFLREKVDVPLVTGYGIGTTISHAMNNAQLASREAKLLECPYAMDSNGNLIGPMDHGANAVITQADRLKLSDIAGRASLSAVTIQKLLMILQSRGTDKITTRELAESLDTTVRNANRIMKNLIEGGFAVPVYAQSSHSRGRPVQVYALNLRLDSKNTNS